MHLAEQTPPEFERIATRAKEVLAELLPHIPPAVKGSKISSNQDVFSVAARKGKLFVLRDGTLSYSVQNRTLFFFDPGDLIGAEHLLTEAQAKILSDFAVVVDEYDGSSFLAAIGKSLDLQRKWSEYLVLQSSLLAALSGTLAVAKQPATPDVQDFPPGAVIIEEGSIAKEIYALVEGTAEVSVNGKVTGEIHEGEIFGVLAALTASPRTVTVKAKDFCLAMVMPREQFIQMIESKPAMILKLMEDMGQTLASLNERGLAMSFSKY